MRHKRYISHRKPQTDTSSMKTLCVKIATVLTILVLALGNIVVFAKSVKLSDSLVTLEEDTRKTKKENVELEKKLYTLRSMENLEIMAEQLGFSKEAEPISLEVQPYALAQ